MEAFKVEITRKIGTISESQTGWRKELNMVSWNSIPAKYDIREWSPDYEKMTRGITLFEEEARALYELLKKEFGE